MESLVAAAVSSTGSGFGDSAQRERLLVAGNLSLLCWTIYLAGQFSARTKQVVSKSRSMERAQGHIKDEFEEQDDLCEEDEGMRRLITETGDKSSGPSNVAATTLKESKKAGYDLLRHLHSLIGYREGAACVSVGALLCLRTLCDLRMIRLSAMIETSIISRRPAMIQDSIKNYLLHIIPYSLLTALLRYAQDELKVTMREGLANKLQELLMKDNSFLHLSTANCDQILTTDLEEFTSIISELFSILLEPTVNVCVYTSSLWQMIGPRAPLSMLAYFLTFGWLLGYLRGPTAEYIYNEQVHITPSAHVLEVFAKISAFSWIIHHSHFDMFFPFIHPLYLPRYLKESIVVSLLEFCSMLKRLHLYVVPVERFVYFYFFLFFHFIVVFNLTTT